MRREVRMFAEDRKNVECMQMQSKLDTDGNRKKKARCTCTRQSNCLVEPRPAMEFRAWS